MTASGRSVARAGFAIAAACAILLSGAILPAFGAAAPAHEVVIQLSDAGSDALSQSAAQRDAGSGTRKAGGAGKAGKVRLQGSGSESMIRLGGIDVALPRGSSLLGGAVGRAAGAAGASAARSAVSGARAPAGAPSVSVSPGLLAQFASLLGQVSTSGSARGGSGGLGVAGSMSGTSSGAGAGGSGSGIKIGTGGGSNAGTAGSGGSTHNAGSDSRGPRGCPSVGNGYYVCFEEKLVPGTNTTVTVRTADGPAPNVRVFVNGDYVGKTDANGEVTVRVPFTRELRVLVRAGGGSASIAGDGTRFFAMQDAEGGTANASITTDLALAVEGERDPGAKAIVRVTIDDVPVPNASVSLDGQQVGRTNQHGELAVTFPVATTATVTAERGDFSATKRIELADVQIGVQGALPLGIALPGQPATVVVTDNGTPVTGATVTLSGSRIGQTGPNGTVSTTLPMRPTIRLGVETRAGLTVQSHKQLWILPGIGLGLLLALAGGVGITYRRSSVTGRGFLEQARVLLGAFAGRLLSLLVSITVGIEATVARVRERIRRAVDSIRALRFPSIDDVQQWLHERIRQWRTSAVARTSEMVDRVTDPLRGSSPEPQTGGSDTLTPRERIERAWRQLLEHVRIPRGRTRTMTPGEVADRAVAVGLPREPVERLTDVFRTVEYSSANPEQYTDAAEHAAAELADSEEERNDS